jgi:TPR repeat protein
MLLRSTVLACGLLFSLSGSALAQFSADPRTPNPGAAGRTAFAAGDFVKAALGADVEAHRLMGDIYSGGHAPEASVPGGRDECAALVWYDHAARMGDGLAMRRMARAYRRGWGVKRDERMAALWAKFADKANAPALLVDPFEKPKKPADQPHRLTQSDVDFMVEETEPAALPFAEIFLVPSFLWNDPDIASGLLQRGLAPCDARPPSASRSQPENRLTASLMKGLVLKAVDNVAQAQLLFADTIMFGGAVPPNTCMATLWVERAARYGHPDAARRMALALVTARGFREDIAMALFWAEVSKLERTSNTTALAFIEYLKDVLRSRLQLQFSDEHDLGV